MADIHPAADNDHRAVQRKLSASSSANVKEKVDVERANPLVGEDCKEEGATGKKTEFEKKLQVALLIALAALILGWWISSTVLKATRDRWQVGLYSESSVHAQKSCRLVQTVFAWFFLM